MKKLLFICILLSGCANFKPKEISVSPEVTCGNGGPTTYKMTLSCSLY